MLLILGPTETDMTEVYDTRIEITPNTADGTVTQSEEDILHNIVQIKPLVCIWIYVRSCKLYVDIYYLYYITNIVSTETDMRDVYDTPIETMHNPIESTVTESE